jgi:hypothetical protein
MRFARPTLVTVLLVSITCLGWSQSWKAHEGEMTRALGSKQAYTDFKTLGNSELYKDLLKDVGEGDLFPGWRMPTRFELAVLIRACIQHGRTVAWRESESGKLEQSTIDNLREDAPILECFAAEYGPEFKRFDLDPGTQISEAHSHSLYADLLDLQRAGHFVQLQAGDRGRRPATRYEMAVCAHYAYSQIRIGVRDGRFDEESKKRELACIDPLTHLMRDFSKELSSMGADMSSTLADLRSLSMLGNRKTAFSETKGLLPERVLEVHAKDGWVKDIIDKLREGDNVRAYPFDSNHQPTNFEIANSLGPTITYMFAFVDADPAMYDRRSLDVGMLSTEYAVKLQSMIKLVDVFSPELRALNVNASALKTQIASAKQQVESLWQPANMSGWSGSTGR